MLSQAPGALQACSWRSTPPPFRPATQHCRGSTLRSCRHGTIVSAVATDPDPGSLALADQYTLSRRQALAVPGAAVLAQLLFEAVSPPTAKAAAKQDGQFVTLPSGLMVLDVREGTGPVPQPGDTCIVHWAGFTKGYQGKRIDNTSVRDEPYEFVLGKGQAIKAFEEAVSSMHVGGIRRVEVPGDHPELGYSRNRSERFTDEFISQDLKIYRYQKGPQPAELGGQRALDFVLDNDTLQNFNRTLLMDIKLLAVRKGRQ